MYTLADFPPGTDFSKCAHCGSLEVACVGAYESMPHPEPACNECCGHGCEDGRCYRIGEFLQDLHGRLREFMQKGNGRPVKVWRCPECEKEHRLDSGTSSLLSCRCGRSTTHEERQAHRYRRIML
jgi:hypothetical protein